jgi:hypothetical protein
MCLAYIGGAIMDWRTLAWTAIIFAIVPVILVQLFVVESPVYLVSKGRIEDAAKSLTYLYKNYPKPDQNESLADMHLRALLRDNEKKIADNSKLPPELAMKDAKMPSISEKIKEFKKPTGYKPLLILFFLFFIQQFSGIYITLFYSVTFLQVIYFLYALLVL